MGSSGPRERRLAYFAWAAVCLIWGTTYLGIRITLETIPPWLMSGMRWIIAGTLLGACLLARGERLPSTRARRGIVFLGVTLLVLGNGGVVWAEQYVPSGLAGSRDRGRLAVLDGWRRSVPARWREAHAANDRGARRWLLRHPPARVA